jgi:hypothetical protein
MVQVFMYQSIASCVRKFSWLYALVKVDAWLYALVKVDAWLYALVKVDAWLYALVKVDAVVKQNCASCINHGTCQDSHGKR